MDKEDYSDEYIQHEMTLNHKCALVAAHPAAASRYFNHRLQKFMQLIITGPHSPLGKVADFFYRVEFQKRGSPHIHGFLWIENAPNIRTATDEEICAYVDSCISVSSDPPQEQVKLQTHSHSRTCKRMQHGKPTCQFGAPWPPMPETRIIHPFQEDTEVDREKMQAQFNDIMKKLKQLPTEVETFKDWLTHINLDESTYVDLI